MWCVCENGGWGEDVEVCVVHVKCTDPMYCAKQSLSNHAAFSLPHNLGN